MRFYLSKSCQQLAITMLLALGLSACGGDKPAENANTVPASNNSTQSTKQATNTENQTQKNVMVDKKEADSVDVVVATDPTNAPFEMRDSTGNIIGLDVDIIDAISKHQNFTYIFKPQNWQGIFENLDNDTSDIISGIVVATDERRAKYDFTDPVFHKRRFAYMKPAMADKIKSFEDICQYTVAFKEQTDKSDIYDSVCGANNPKRQGVVSNYVSFGKVASGAVDIAIGDDVIFNYYMKDNNVTDLVTIPDPSGEAVVLAWPVKKGNKELVEKFNKGLKTIKDNGEYDKIINKWMGN